MTTNSLFADEPPHKRRKNGKTFSHDEDSLHYGAELVIYDKHRRCLLTDGDYEVALQDLGSQPLPKGQAAWETVMDGKVKLLLPVSVIQCVITPFHNDIVYTLDCIPPTPHDTTLPNDSSE